MPLAENCREKLLLLLMTALAAVLRLIPTEHVTVKPSYTVYTLWVNSIFTTTNKRREGEGERGTEEEKTCIQKPRE